MSAEYSDGSFEGSSSTRSNSRISARSSQSKSRSTSPDSPKSPPQRLLRKASGRDIDASSRASSQSLNRGENEDTDADALRTASPHDQRSGSSQSSQSRRSTLNGSTRSRSRSAASSSSGGRHSDDDFAPAAPDEYAGNVKQQTIDATRLDAAPDAGRRRSSGASSSTRSVGFEILPTSTRSDGSSSSGHSQTTEQGRGGKAGANALLRVSVEAPGDGVTGTPLGTGKSVALLRSRGKSIIFARNQDLFQNQRSLSAVPKVYDFIEQLQKTALDMELSHAQSRGDPESAPSSRRSSLGGAGAGTTMRTKANGGVSAGSISASTYLALSDWGPVFRAIAKRKQAGLTHLPPAASSLVTVVAGFLHKLLVAEELNRDHQGLPPDSRQQLVSKCAAALETPLSAENTSLCQQALERINNTFVFANHNTTLEMLLIAYIDKHDGAEHLLDFIINSPCSEDAMRSMVSWGTPVYREYVCSCFLVAPNATMDQQLQRERLCRTLTGAEDDVMLVFSSIFSVPGDTMFTKGSMAQDLAFRGGGFAASGDARSTTSDGADGPAPAENLESPSKGGGAAAFGGASFIATTTMTSEPTSIGLLRSNNKDFANALVTLLSVDLAVNNHFHPAHNLLQQQQQQAKSQSENHASSMSGSMLHTGIGASTASTFVVGLLLYPDRSNEVRKIVRELISSSVAANIQGGYDAETYLEATHTVLASLLAVGGPELYQAFSSILEEQTEHLVTQAALVYAAGRDAIRPQLHRYDQGSLVLETLEYSVVALLQVSKTMGSDLILPLVGFSFYRPSEVPIVPDSDHPEGLASQMSRGGGDPMAPPGTFSMTTDKLIKRMSFVGKKPNTPLLGRSARGGKAHEKSELQLALEHRKKMERSKVSSSAQGSEGALFSDGDGILPPTPKWLTETKAKVTESAKLWDRYVLDNMNSQQVASHSTLKLRKAVSTYSILQRGLTSCKLKNSTTNVRGKKGDGRSHPGVRGLRRLSPTKQRPSPLQKKSMTSSPGKKPGQRRSSPSPKAGPGRQRSNDSVGEGNLMLVESPIAEVASEDGYSYYDTDFLTAETQKRLDDSSYSFVTRMRDASNNLRETVVIKKQQEDQLKSESRRADYHRKRKFADYLRLQASRVKITQAWENTQRNREAKAQARLQAKEESEETIRRLVAAEKEKCRQFVEEKKRSYQARRSRHSVFCHAGGGTMDPELLDEALQEQQTLVQQEEVEQAEAQLVMDNTMVGNDGTMPDGYDTYVLRMAQNREKKEQYRAATSIDRYAIPRTSKSGGDCPAASPEKRASSALGSQRVSVIASPDQAKKKRSLTLPVKSATPAASKKAQQIAGAKQHEAKISGIGLLQNQWRRIMALDAVASCRNKKSQPGPQDGASTKEAGVDTMKTKKLESEPLDPLEKKDLPESAHAKQDHRLVLRLQTLARIATACRVVAEKRGKTIIQLSIRRCAALLQRDGAFTGKSDPFVKVFQYGRLIHSTRVVEDRLNPVWPKGSEVAEVTKGAEVSFEVWEDDTVRHQFLGCAKFNPMQHGPVEIDLALQKRANEEDGEIREAKSLGVLVISLVRSLRGSQNPRAQSGTSILVDGEHYKLLIHGAKSATGSSAQGEKRTYLSLSASGITAVACAVGEDDTGISRWRVEKSMRPITSSGEDKATLLPERTENRALPAFTYRFASVTPADTLLALTATDGNVGKLSTAASDSGTGDSDFVVVPQDEDGDLFQLFTVQHVGEGIELLPATAKARSKATGTAVARPIVFQALVSHVISGDAK